MSFWVLSCEYTYRFFALLWAVVEPLSSMLSIDKPHNGTCGTILLYTVRIASKLKYRQIPVYNHRSHKAQVLHHL